MTKEEVLIAEIKDHLDSGAWKDEACWLNKEDLEVIIRALEASPCEDCISRQAVLDKLNRLIEVERLQGTDEMGYGRERVSAYENMIFEIESEYLYPPVTQQEPTTGIFNRIVKEIEACREAEDPHLCDYRHNRNEGLDTAISIIEKYMQEPKTGHWILVSERLPEEGQIVLVCQIYSWAQCEDGVEVTIAQYKRKHFTWYRYQKDWDKHTSIMTHGDVCPGNEYVAAWMPLPEPIVWERIDG